MFTFNAKYEQPCWACGERINEGEPMARSDGRKDDAIYGHIGCVEAMSRQWSARLDPGRVSLPRTP